MQDKAEHVGATWFTNLSAFQLQAIVDLNIAIRDDGAEGTVYRTHSCLCLLGLTPMVKKRMLSKLLQACRGSDLAFLYFLLEACYKAAGFEYSARIIMSAITYLDLEMTMRELDRILPPGVDRLKAKCRSRLGLLDKKSIYSRPPPAIAKPKPVGSPYFMPLPKPKVSSGGNVVSKPARFVVTFPFWPAGERPNYKVNEESRWFAKYKFQPVRRMLYNMLGDIMTEYWTQVGAPDPDGAAPLCEFHQNALAQEQLLKDAALVKAHKLCLLLVDSTTREDEARRKRIVAQLGKGIEDCTLRWKRLRQRHLTDVMLLEDHDQLCAMGTVPTDTKPNKVKCLYHEEDIAQLSASPSMGVHVITGQNTISQLSTVQISDPCDVITCPIEANEKRPDRCPPLHAGKKKPSGRMAMTPIIANGDRSLKCKKPWRKGRFFKGPQGNGPFVFHYHEIPPKEEYLAPRDVIRQQIIRSLRESADSCASSEDGYNARLSTREQVVAAIVQCVDGMWFGSLEAHQRSENSTKTSELEHTDPNPACERLTGLEWTQGIERFDPDNLQQMNRLLRDAFAVLQRDPRFVFAAFPNAHKSNVMLEWIKRRYGKTYSNKEIFERVQQSMPIFSKVQQQLRLPPKVETEGLPNSKFTYANHDNAVELANRIKANYRVEFNEKILAVVRTCWKAMHPHLQTSSSMLNTFFAYLPVRYTDMMR